MCGAGRGEGSQMYMVKSLRGYLKQSVHLLALFASLGQGDAGGALHF